MATSFSRIQYCSFDCHRYLRASASIFSKNLVRYVDAGTASASKRGVLASDAEKISVFDKKTAFGDTLCFHIEKVLEFVAKKESLQLPHGFTALQVLLGNIREALHICLCNCPTLYDELFYPGDKDTEAHKLFRNYVSIITWSFKSQLISFYRSSSRRRVNGELEDEPLHMNIIITEKDDCYSFNKTMLQILFIRHSIMIIETKADL
ncbi:unnamed protein product [Brassica oleracea var. botrytis]